MTRRVLTVVAALLAVVAFDRYHSSAQEPSDRSVRGGALTLEQPVVLAGADVGFRVLRVDGQTPVGQVVVRMNDAWVAAETIN